MNSANRVWVFQTKNSVEDCLIITVFKFMMFIIIIILSFYNWTESNRDVKWFKYVRVQCVWG